MITTKEAFIDAKEVSQVLGVGMTKAYAVIKAYNAELDARGFYTMRGKCPRKYFEQKIYGYADYYNPGNDLTRKAGMVAEECHYQTKEKSNPIRKGLDCKAKASLCISQIHYSKSIWLLQSKDT